MSSLVGRAIEALRPRRYVESLVGIDPAGLAADGIRGLVIDFDNTMVPRRTQEATDELVAWLERVGASGIAVCIVSNNFGTRIVGAAERLGLPVVTRAAKPRAKAFQLGMQAMQTAPSETAVIGDQLFTDVLGGNRLGLATILVIPLPGPDLPHTLVLRRIEARLLRWWMRHGGLSLERVATPGGDAAFGSDLKR